MLGLLPLAALLAIFLCLSPGSKAGATPVDLTVMTQNLYVGADADAVSATRRSLSPSSLLLAVPSFTCSALMTEWGSGFWPVEKSESGSLSATGD